jgi:hypothetical protein
MAKTKKHAIANLKSVVIKRGKKLAKTVKSAISRKAKTPAPTKAKLPAARKAVARKTIKKTARKAKVRVPLPTIEQLVHSGEPLFVTPLDEV